MKRLKAVRKHADIQTRGGMPLSDRDSQRKIGFYHGENVKRLSSDYSRELLAVPQKYDAH